METLTRAQLTVRLLEQYDATMADLATHRRSTRLHNQRRAIVQAYEHYIGPFPTR